MWAFAGRDTAIDLGSTTVRMHVRDRGVVCREPSLLARCRHTGRILALGSPARDMAGRNPDVTLVRPIREGAPTETDEAEYLMRHLVRRHHRRHYTARPRLVVTVPSGMTSVHYRALQFSAFQAGARRLTLVPTPIAAAIGMGLTSSGRSEITVIADIGADLTDVGVISFGGLVSSHTAPIGGSALDRAIVALVRREHGVVLSPSAAEAAKLEVGAVPPLGRHPVRQTVVNGRDITTGMPRGLVLTTVDVGRAIAGPVARIVDAIRAGLAGCSPEISGDLLGVGVTLTGGCARLPGLERLIHDRTGLDARLGDDTGDAAVLGAGEVLRSARSPEPSARAGSPRPHLLTAVPEY
ncbi:rod shape-determining protein [Actinomadura madurae]|uniref:rod shape-determining protein n=1 Tax=Actinomadura madurae TaxID=1993 RepID=UPI0020266873|nr:rod shape-determining protein [Actinomadura madurae]MCP9965329.1 rod shape-determining protein [Actinomadura madurae]URM94200.1 rod shape-determining protein [Actinomadura madurae]URN04906.1 rod shape-determining protein [Actinomadura madurae]